MDIQKLFETLSECVAKSVDSPGVEVVKMHNIEVPVITAEAKKHEKELRKLLLDYPEPERLASGPSYIEVGAAVGSQRTAFILFAVGKVLRFWTVITPESLGIKELDASQLAGGGMIMISGYNSAT